MNVVLLRDGDDFEIEFDFANLMRGNAVAEVAASLWLMFEKKPRNLPWLFRCRRNVRQHHATGTYLTQFVQSGAPAHGKHWHTPHDHAIQRFDIEPVFMNFRTIYRNHIQALYWLPQGHRLAATDKNVDGKPRGGPVFHQYGHSRLWVDDLDTSLSPYCCDR